MRYLSLFDGIGAASVAWEPLGWKCVAVSEIDAFPIAVTKHHRPDTPHIGDVTKITEERIAALGRIDLVVGGFPCQDLSVAGKRQGLRNDDGTLTRSGLFYDAIRLVQWARKHCGCRWLLIENVPGLFSSNGGRDFAAVVGAVVGTGFDVPRDGWRNSGAAFGPEGLAEWCTLDAQFFGLAQRRKRVFLVGHFGDWRRAAAVLFDAASLRGDPAPRREAGKGVARPLASCPAGGSGYRNDVDTAENLIPQPHAAISPALKARDSKGVSSDGDGDGAILVPMVAHSLDSFSAGRATEDGTGRGCPLVPVAPYTLAIRGRGDSHDLEYRQDGTANAILTPNGGRAGIGVGAVAFSCKDYGADVGEVAPTLRSMGHDGSHANAGGQVAVAFDARQSDVIQYGEKTGPLDTSGFTMGVLEGDDYAGAYEADASSILRTLRQTVGAETVAEWGSRVLDSLQSPEVLRSWLHGESIRRSSGDFRSFVDDCPLPRAQGAAAATLRKVWENGPDGCSPQGRGLAKQLAQQLGKALPQLPPARTQAQPVMSVRRLTPVECERLMGFPDDYTAIFYRGKPAADGNRYKALGNSMAVPVMAWIGRRIQAVDSIQKSDRTESSLRAAAHTPPAQASDEPQHAPMGT